MMVYWVSLTLLFNYFGVMLIFLSEELLINFKKLIGEHSGENMADIIWGILNLYRITDKVAIA